MIQNSPKYDEFQSKLLNALFKLGYIRIQK